MGVAKISTANTIKSIITHSGRRFEVNCLEWNGVLYVVELCVCESVHIEFLWDWPPRNRKMEGGGVVVYTLLNTCMKQVRLELIEPFNTAASDHVLR